MLGKYDFREAEKRTADFWAREEIYKFAGSERSEVYSIDTPPPYVSGALHIGHVFSYTQADFIARYKRMGGYKVFYPMGFDNNGLPTELRVEKDFNVIASQLGREKFIELVEKTADKYEEEYRKAWKAVGLSVDWSLLYRTIDRNAQKASQLSFIDLYGMGRVYRKETPTMWCPKEKTAVSQMELKDKKVKSKFVYLRFSEGVEIATTRPELLPACVAVFVNPDDEKHKKLIGRKVKVPLFGNEVRVIADKRVDPEKGTGVVMCCTFGDQTDIEWYKAYDLELRIAMDKEGRMLTGEYKGMKAKQARDAITEKLKQDGYVIKEDEIEHDVNTHDRCGTEVEFLVTPQWYIRILDLKEELLKRGDELEWHPDFQRHRYANWINGLQWDWGISRQRFFGIPFPVWYCAKCGEVKLAERKHLPVDPLAAKPEGKCAKCGSSEFVPEEDIMDTWATSSLTPLINARWALDGKYMNTIYPMDLRPQGHDIISTWLFSTIVKCHLHTGKLPWRSVLINGHGLDSKGRSMHKSIGNVIDANEAMEKYSADALRYWAASSSVGEDASFQEKDMVGAQRVVNKLWNVGSFIEQNCKTFGKGHERTVDKWIMTRSTLLVKQATESFEELNFSGAKRAVEEFFWFFADNYLEFIKYRIYNKDESQNHALAATYLTLLKLFAPFIPYATEEIYQKVFRGKLDDAVSIHVSKWPDVEGGLIDEEALTQGDKAQKVIAFIRQWKHNNKMALNAEIRELVISEGLGDLDDDLRGAMNIKKITHGEGSLAVPDTEIKVDIKK